MTTFKYKVTKFASDSASQNDQTITLTWTGEPTEFIKKVREGDPEVWARARFGQRNVKLARVTHYVGATYYGRGSNTTVKYCLEHDGAFACDYYGNPTETVQFFRGLHDRMWQALKDEFTAEELSYISAEITDTKISKEMMKYRQTFASNHVYSAK